MEEGRNTGLAFNKKSSDSGDRQASPLPQSDCLKNAHRGRVRKSVEKLQAFHRQQKGEGIL